jgi:hypothetical protein
LELKAAITDEDNHAAEELFDLAMELSAVAAGRGEHPPDDQYVVSGHEGGGLTTVLDCQSQIAFGVAPNPRTSAIFLTKSAAIRLEWPLAVRA